ncbi:MAG: bifunctional heptose 7-phosphate kinase/heptose 1-phosphate adenyltransferase, partial [Longimicrobiales bacterium]
AVVAGDLMVDRYITGVVERVSPEAPVPVVRVEKERAAIGGAGNVAANIAALGAGCAVAGCIGDDADGRALLDAFQERGIDTSGIVVASDRPTTVKTRVMARHQQIVRFDREDESDVSDTVGARLAESVRQAADDADTVILEDYNKGVLTAPVIRAALEAASARGIPSVVDPKRRNFFAFSGVTVFKPNAKELEDALGTFIHPEDAEWMARTRKRLTCEHLLLTLGERGMALEAEGVGHVRVPTAARAVYDVSGAGDTVTAVVATVLAAGGSPVEAAELANHAAAVEVGKTGVATVNPQEILDHIEAHLH